MINASLNVIVSVRVIANVLKNQNVVQLHVHIYVYILSLKKRFRQSISCI